MQKFKDVAPIVVRPSPSLRQRVEAIMRVTAAHWAEEQLLSSKPFPQPPPAHKQALLANHTKEPNKSSKQKS
jgi:hypothetical protein